MEKEMDISKHITDLLGVYSVGMLYKRLNYALEHYPAPGLSGGNPNPIGVDVNTLEQKRSYIDLLRTLTPVVLETSYGKEAASQMRRLVLGDKSKENSALIMSWVEKQNKGFDKPKQEGKQIKTNDFKKKDFVDMIDSFLDELGTMFVYNGKEQRVEPIEDMELRYISILKEINKGSETLFKNTNRKKYEDLVWKIEGIIKVYKTGTWQSEQMDELKLAINELFPTVEPDDYLASVFMLKEKYLNEVFLSLKRYIPEPFNEPTPDNIEAQSANQKVLLLCTFGIIEYLESTYSLSKTQSFKIVGTLTGEKWDSIQRIYNAYKTGINSPRNENKNNPVNEINRNWLLNLLNGYKIDMPE